tara:strand:+ start:120 stop:443 length:324 start_codon:yes stop_codon:yes gene_type:complete
MKVQINKLKGELEIKSSTQRTSVLNIQCVLYQKSVLELGIAYVIEMRNESRTNKLYNSWDRKAKNYEKVYDNLDKALRNMFPQVSSESRFGDIYKINKKSCSHLFVA